MNAKEEIPQFEFYAWIEDDEELVLVLDQSYHLANAKEIPLQLVRAGGLLDVDPDLGSEHFIDVTLMQAEPTGTYLGETWADLSGAEAWQRVFDFQRRCCRTCVYVSGTGLPPENVQDFLARATRSQRGLF